MANPDRNNKPDIEKSEQEVLNKSFDRNYNVLAVELLAENATQDGLVRLNETNFGASPTYESFVDTTTDVNLVYLGKATPGTATSAGSWQIKRYNKSAGHMSYADDVTTFTKTWDDRVSYTY